jgi:hypothetical protein
LLRDEEVEVEVVKREKVLEYKFRRCLSRH